jgi:hypothetical protein
LCVIIYKYYQFALTHFKDFVYYKMSKDISRLHFHHPIYQYLDAIPTKFHINYVYGKLGIIDYNDYIYCHSPDMQTLNQILHKN